ncbi:hypothetical protein [Acinetobacter sp. ETR1]|uniref:hypothetical protein n=1 Tax=Acinetobacter sp. ETR1 TaxID=1485002 RepID=UPI0004DA079C|nr:hypothetical protein [Acinetobacter sp. ETR1]KEC84214.1 hypothetical protein DT74_09815 [Acinetobacter sp. ETR1]
MKYIVGALLIIVLLVGYFINKSNKEDMARLKKAEVEQQQKVKNEKYTAELNLKIKEIQSKIDIDQNEAKKIIESEKISSDGKKFYSDLAGRWADAVKIASSTPRMALAQPVKELQNIRRDLEVRQTTNYCDEIVKQNLYKSFDYGVDGFIDFMQDNKFKSEMNSELSSKYMNNSLILTEYCYM